MTSGSCLHHAAALRGVGWKRRHSKLSLKPIAHPNLVFSTDDYVAHPLDRFDDFEASFRSQNKYCVVDFVGEKGRRRPNRDASRSRRRTARARIDDVVIALSFEDVASLVVARGA